MAQMQVFVSHSHEDDAFCRAIVVGLRDAGADVWYDEHNLGSGQLMELIQRELGRRPVVILILSKAAFASRWVRREITWAYELLDRDPSHLLLPVTAGPIARDDFSPENGWLFLHDFKRIEASGYQPFSIEEVVPRLLHALALTPAREAPISTVPQPSESVADLVERGKALIAQKRYAETLSLFDRAAQLTASSFEVWVLFGFVLGEVGHYEEALKAYDQALALEPNNALAWYNDGVAFTMLNRDDEALTAYDRSLALDPRNAFSWSNKGLTLNKLARYDQALEVLDRALTLDPGNARTWNNKADTLNQLMRYQEALEALDRALALGESAGRWAHKAMILRALGRTTEAEAAERRAKELGR